MNQREIEIIEILKKFHAQYKVLCDIIDGCNIPDAIRRFISQNLDQGLLWFKEGLIQSGMINTSPELNPEGQEESVPNVTPEPDVSPEITAS